MDMPDYNNSLVNLMNSVALGCGAEPQFADLYPPLAALDTAQLSGAKNIVLIVIDGLGYDYLTTAGAGGAMHKHLHCALDSVAPPTTAASITTFLTGQAPQQHGLTGWFTWLREVGCVTKVLPFVARGSQGNLADAGVSVKKLFGHTPFFDHLPRSCYSLTPDWLGESVFNRAHLGKAELCLHRGVTDFFNQIGTLALAHDHRKYIYGYWPSFDGMAHDSGVGSVRVKEHFEQLDRHFQGLCERLAGSDTLLLLTADHGFVDTPPERRLKINDMPELAECLQIPLCGEPRLPYCYVQPRMRERFVDLVERRLKGIATLHSGADLIDAGLYGRGEPHPELHSRVGEFVLELAENYTLVQQLPGEGELKMVGYHGGLSAAEMKVPLVLASL